jgi:two-component system sensor histidine kinase ChvG
VLTLPDGAVPVNGAPELYAQMLDKLVANAVEFSNDGAIDISLARDEEAARPTVANAGPPLPAGMEDRLFESMVSVREGSTGSAPHLGLGLYIVRLIAQFHGGTATAENRAEPPGVAVIVRLPLAP